MSGLVSMGSPWLFLWCYGLTLASAIFPWVNAELIVLSLPTFAPSRSSLVVLALVATAGQMTGKCALYWAGRRGDRVLPERAKRLLAKWQHRLEAKPSRAVLLVLISAVTGLPPFYVITLVAGTLKIKFPVYLAAGAAGRLVHFSALIFVPNLLVLLYRGS